MPRLNNLPDPAIVQRFKQTLDYYVWRGLACVRAWPRPPRHPRTAAVHVAGMAFAAASRDLRYLAPRYLLAARVLSRGTEWTWKDLTTRALYGHLYTLDESPAPRPLMPIISELITTRAPTQLLIEWTTLDPGVPLWVHATLQPPSRTPRTVILRGVTRQRGWSYRWTDPTITAESPPPDPLHGLATITNIPLGTDVHWMLSSSPVANTLSSATIPLTD